MSKRLALPIAVAVVTSALGCAGLLPGGPAPVDPSGPVTPGVVPQVRVEAGPLSSSKDPIVRPPFGPEHCDDVADGGEVQADGCLTGELRCGETIVGHTVGGIRRYDTAFYERSFCWPATREYGGGDERVYKLTVPPGDKRVVVTLDTPCADLDMAAMLWPEDTCPPPTTQLPRCEMQPEPSTRREQLELVSQKGATWWIVVEGRDDEEGAFGLSVQCFDGLY